MALTGSTGDAGKRRPRRSPGPMGATTTNRYDRPSRYQAEKAGSYDRPENQPRVQTGAEKRVDALRDLEREAQGGYSPSDFVKQVYGFPGKLYNEADQTVRGLIHAGGEILSGKKDPAQALNLGDMPRQLAENVTHPVEWANDRPLDFMLTTAGLAGLSEAALSRAAAARGATVPEWLGSEEGAIGRLGERLNRGEVPTSVESIEGMVPSSQVTATSPGMSLVKYGDEADLGVFKPRSFMEVQTGVPGQAASEAVSSRLNTATGSRVRMPGMQEGTFPYQNPHTFGPEFGGTTPFPPENLPGTLIEYLDNVRKIDTYENHPGLAPGWTNPATPEWTQSMRNQNIFDQAIGNVDRGYGQNMFEHEGLPIAIDQGTGMARAGYSPSMVEPRAWGGDWSLRPGDLEWIQQMTQAAPNIGATEGGLRGLLMRLKQMMDYREMPVGPNYDRGMRI